jgi:hypothetical protein
MGLLNCVTCKNPRPLYFRCDPWEKKEHVHKQKENKCEGVNTTACFRVSFNEEIDEDVKIKLDKCDSMWICAQAHLAEPKGMCHKKCGSTAFFQIVKLPWFLTHVEKKEHKSLMTLHLTEVQETKTKDNQKCACVWKTLLGFKFRLWRCQFCRDKDSLEKKNTRLPTHPTKSLLRNKKKPRLFHREL